MILAMSSCRTPTPAKWRTCSRIFSLTTNALLAMAGPRLILLLAAGALIERLTRGLVHRRASGEGLPAPHDDIDVGGVELEAVTDPAGHFGGNNARARAEKRVIDQLAGPAVVDHRAPHTLDRLLRAMPPAVLALSITERIVIGALPERCLGPVTLPMAGLALAYGVPAAFVLPVIIAPAQCEMLLGPDDLSAHLQPASRQAGGDDVAVHRPVPDISDISREQRIGLPPVSAIVVEHFPPRELAGTATAARSPGRVVADTVGRIGDHQIRLRSRQHQLDICRAGTVATADPVGAQEPHVAGPSDRLIESFRDAVGIGQTARPQAGQYLLQPVRLEADQVEVETAKLEKTQLVAEQIGVPARPRRELIVGQAIGLLLVFAPPARDDHRDGGQFQLCRGRDTSMARNRRAVFVDQRGVRPTPFKDRRGDFIEVGLAVKPRVVRVRYQPFDRPPLDLVSGPRPCQTRLGGRFIRPCHCSSPDGRRRPIWLEQYGVENYHTIIIFTYGSQTCLCVLG